MFCVPCEEIQGLPRVGATLQRAPFSYGVLKSMTFPGQPLWSLCCSFARSTVEQLVGVTTQLFSFASIGVWQTLAFSELRVTDTHMPWENPVLCILCYTGEKGPDQMFSDEELGLC